MDTVNQRFVNAKLSGKVFTYSKKKKKTLGCKTQNYAQSHRQFIAQHNFSLVFVFFFFASWTNCETVMKMVLVSMPRSIDKCECRREKRN